MGDSLERDSRLKWLILVLPTAVSIYSSILLARNWFPGVGTSGLFFVYFLSIGALALALGLTAFVSGSLLVWRDARRQPSPVSRRIFIGSGLSLLGLAVIVALARFIPAGLPAGSRLLRFDPVAWRQATSTEFVAGGITIRQKMLGDVVDNVLPGRSRADIESALGPSLDTSYFRGTGRDLIYVLGPERASYFVIDSEWLLIWLDSAGRFDRYAIYTD
jgi:hypothetical protein